MFTFYNDENNRLFCKNETKNMKGARKMLNGKNRKAYLWMLSQHSLDSLNWNKAREYKFNKKHFPEKITL